MSQRTTKLNSLLQQKIGQIISQEIELPNNALATITRVQTSSDIKSAKIFITVLPDNMRGTVLQILRKNQANIRKELKKGMTTKFIPNLHFVIDENEIFASKIEKILDEL